MAPEWEDNACGAECQEWVSACMLSHVNLTGIHVPIWIDAAQENVGWGRSDDYPRQEGAYFGNIFIDHPVAYACKGRDADVNPIEGRLCLGDEECPYGAVPVENASCAAACQSHESGDGYTACTVDGRRFTRPITVWTH